MPIFAVVRVSETSVKTGAPEGKELPTATVLATPLTEIAAVVALCATGVAARLISVLGGRFLERGFVVDPGLAGEGGWKGTRSPNRTRFRLCRSKRFHRR